MDHKAKGNYAGRLKNVKVAAFMTAPRYENTWCRNVIEAALKTAKIPLVISGGVFYGQCMERMLFDAINAGVEMAITVDGDSVFTATDVKHLLSRITYNDEIDALAALQCRRGGIYPLMTLGDPNAEQCEFDGDPMRVKTAHFGLTAIRLDKLKTVPNPWFWSRPDDENTWFGNKVDDDIWFWKQWESAGHTVYVDPQVSIGHLEEVVSRYDETGAHCFEYPNDWFVENVDPTQKT